MNRTAEHPFYRKSSMLTLLLNLALILPPAFLYSMKIDMPHIFLISAGLLLVCFFKKNYLTYTDRPIIYSIVAALVLAVIPDMILTVEESRFGLFDLMLRSSLIVPLLLYSAALTCFFLPNSYRTGVTAALALAAMLICGDIFNSEKTFNTLLPFLNSPLRNYRTTYAVTVVIQALALPFFFYSTTRTIYAGETHRTAAWTRSLLRLTAILLIPLLAFSFSKFYSAHTSLFRDLELYFLRLGMRQVTDRGKSMMILSSTVDLNATMQSSLLNNPDKVLIRAKADAPPGYLRGGAYTVYEKGQWFTKTETTPLPSVRRATILSDNTFTIPSFPGAPAHLPENPRETPPEPIRRVELYFDGLLTRGIVPVPGNTYRLDAVADNADISEQGILSLKLWKRDGGCTFFVTDYAPRAAYPLPSPRNPMLTKVPELLTQPMKRISNRIFSVRKPRRDRDKLNAVIEFLDRNCIYSLDFRPPDDGSDPVLHFLTKVRKGHCELFASSAVLLLRSMGFPARYITGLICMEQNPYSQYYLARASNAHAWGEVYLPDEKRWVLVEATPPSDELPSAFKDREQSFFASISDLFILMFQQAFADVRRGNFANAVLMLIETTLLFLKKYLLHPAAAIPLVLIAAYLLRRRFRRAGNRKNGTEAHSREMRRLISDFDSFERKYAKKTHRTRRPDQTLQSFYATAPQAVRELVEDYETLRYREQPPTQEQHRRFVLRCKNSELIRFPE